MASVDSNHAASRHRSSSGHFGEEPPQEFDLEAFFEARTNFNGSNTSAEVRKLCTVCRAVVSRPVLLLLYEESLDFGLGAEENLRLLGQLLPTTTIICITKTNNMVFEFTDIILMDAGIVVDRGQARKLLKNPDSYFFTYIRETDKKTFRLLEQALCREEEPDVFLVDADKPPTEASKETEKRQAEKLKQQQLISFGVSSPKHAEKDLPSHDKKPPSFEAQEKELQAFGDEDSLRLSGQPILQLAHGLSHSALSTCV